MAKATLPTNYKDDIMATQMGGLRRYRPIQNDDGTVSFEDVTDYTQVGSNFGAAQMNQTNTAVNNSADKSKIIDSLADVAANTQEGMMAGALAVRELNGKTDCYGGYNGYTVSAEIRNETISIKIRGSANTNLGTKNGYASVGAINGLIEVLKNRTENIIKYVCVSPSIFGQISIEKSTGNVRVGYTYDSSGNPTDIPQGTEIWYEETFSRCQ